MKRALILGIICLIIGMIIQPTYAISISMDDPTPPELEVTWERYKNNSIQYIDFICEAYDEESGIDRVEMYIDDVLNETITNPNSSCVFTLEWFRAFRTYTFKFSAYNGVGYGTRMGMLERKL